MEEKRRKEQKDSVRFTFKPVHLHYLCEATLSDEAAFPGGSRSADTNPADFKLPFNMIFKKKQVLNLNGFFCSLNQHASNLDGC